MNILEAIFYAVLSLLTIIVIFFVGYFLLGFVDWLVSDHFNILRN